MKLTPIGTDRHHDWCGAKHAARLLLGVLLANTLLAHTMFAPALRAQATHDPTRPQGQRPAVPPFEEPEEDFEAPQASATSFGNHRGTFSLVRDPKRAHQWRQAESFLEQDRGEAAVESLLEVLETSPATVLDKDGDRYVGLRVVARDTLGALPASARALYQRRIELEAQPLLERALARGNVAELQALSERFPNTTQSRTALLAAGDLYLEGGQFVRALEFYTALPRNPSDEALWSRLLYTRRMLDLPIAPHRLPASLPGLVWAGERHPPADWLERSADARPEPVRAPWPSFGGGLSNARFAPEPEQPWDEAWQQRLNRLQSNDRSVLSDVFPISDGRSIFISTGNALYGLDGYSSRGWVFEGPLHFDGDPGSFLASVNRHITHTASLGGGLVVAPLQVPVATDAASGNRSFNGIPIMSRLPVRRLYALEKDTGRLRWSHWGPDGRMPEGIDDVAIDVSGPPLVVGQTVFAATHKQLGTIALHLSAFDLETGAPRWSTLICSSQIEVNMFGNAQIEHVASPLAYDDGVIYGSTNLGVLFAIDARDGAIRWLRAYDIIPIPRARMMPRQRPVYWGNNPPLVAEGVVVFTPLDSEDALAVDQADAELLWKTSYAIGADARRSRFGHSGPQLRWLLGASQGRAIFSGQCIAAVPLRPDRPGLRAYPRVLASEASLGQEHAPPAPHLGRGILTKKWIYHLSDTGTLYKLDHAGNVVDADRQRRVESERGNLISAGGILYSAADGHVTSYFSRTALMSEAARRVRERPGDPALLLELAELHAADESSTLVELGRTAELFERAVQGFRAKGDAGPAARRAEFGHFEARTQLARKRFELDPARAKDDYAKAIATGAALCARHAGDVRLERDLLRLLGETIARYPRASELRESVLRRLETEHAETNYLFPGKGRMPAGLFATLVRYEDLAAKPRPTQQEAAEQLALLQRMLRRWPDEQIDVVPSRQFAVAQMRTLLDKHGEALYAPFEEEAQALLESAGRDTTRLRSILDAYPLSRAARQALLRLAERAAESGDLETALLALRMAVQRLPALPPELLAATAKAAEQRGNLRLAATLRGGAAAASLPEVLTRQEQFAGRPHQRVARARLDGFSRMPRLELVRDVEGFRDRDETDPVLFSDGESIRAFALPQPGTTTLTELWRAPYQRHRYPERPLLCGPRLVLVEDQRLAALSPADGRLHWELDLTQRHGPGCAIVRAGPLRSGLVGIVLELAGDGGAQHVILGVEPLTGVTLFDVALPGGGETPSLVAGELFRVRNPGSDRAAYAELELFDPRFGTRNQELHFGQEGRPGFRDLAEGRVLVAPEGIYVLQRERSGMTAPGLYALKGDGTLRWKHEVPRRAPLGPLDGFVLSGPLVLLLLDVDAQEGTTLLRFDRGSGRAMKPVDCGAQGYLVRDPDTRAALLPAGPELLLASEDGGRPRLLQIDTRPEGSSWLTPLPTWAPEDLGLLLRPDLGGHAVGEDLVAIARAQHQRRDRSVEVTLLRRESGHLAPAPALQTLPWLGTLQLASRRGQLLVHVGRELLIFADPEQAARGR